MGNRQAGLILLLLPCAAEKQRTGRAPAGQASNLLRCALARPDPRQALSAESAVLMPILPPCGGTLLYRQADRAAAWGAELSAWISQARSV